MSRPGTASTKVMPGADVSPWRRTLRYWISRVAVAAITRAWVRVRVEGRDRLPEGAAIYYFNHLSWSDPFVLMAALPLRPRLYFFGPKEEDMRVGGRNRVMMWTGTAIPYKPGKNDLLEATKRVAAVIESGGVVAIAGEGRIGAVESRIWPLNQGPAYFALRSKVPLVPVAVNGTSWIRFGGHVRVRIGEPLMGEGRRDRATVEALTVRASAALESLVTDAPDVPEPGRVGRWLTEHFNEWPEGSRAATLAAMSSPAAGDPADD